MIPCGLGARDTLRLEAAMRLYGNDIDETTSVLEADLGWIVGWNKPDFLGADALRRQKADGVTREARRASKWTTAASHATDTTCSSMDAKAGVVTSGTQTPFLKKAIGMAYVPADRAAAGTTMEIDIRGRRTRARVVPLPFYKRAPLRSEREGTMLPGRPQVHQGPRVGARSPARKAKSASPTTRRSSSATSSTSSCRRWAARVKQGEVFGTIESVKAVSELFSPASGEVVAVNSCSAGQPGNGEQRSARHLDDQLKLDESAETSGLLDGAQYADLVK